IIFHTMQEEKKTGQEEEMMENEHSQEESAEQETVEIGSDEELDIDVEIGEPSPEDAIAVLSKELEKARNEKQDAEEEMLRLRAEFTNFRKRKEKESEESIRYSNVSFLKTMLPIFDNLERTISAIRKANDLDDALKAADIIESYVAKQFEKLGITPIETKDKEFDVDLHEAISAVPVEDEEMKGRIIDEVEKGYTFKDRIVRFSKVVVGE
ncbi:MAG: nucleotide exchange factor GrpE, partial [Bacteroidota bacterium]